MSVTGRGFGSLAAALVVVLASPAWAAPSEPVVSRQAIVRQLAGPPGDRKGLVVVEDAGHSDSAPPAMDFPNIQFELGSSRLTASARAQLDELAAALAADELRNFRFEIVGHTDARGSRAHNQALSERRALVVRDYLLRRAPLDPRRLVAAGRGEEAPLHEEDPAAPANRRVEIRNVGALR